MITQIITFIVAIFVLSWLSSRLISTLADIAKYLRWREFIIAFFVMAFAACLPNLFVDLNAVLNKMPEIAFGDIVGGNLVDLTLVIAIAVLFSRKGLPAESELVQRSAIFTAAIAVLPILLAGDSRLDRVDGVILLGTFALYVWWLFSKDDRFKKAYVGRPKKLIKGRWDLIYNLTKIVVFLSLILATSYFIIDAAKYFSVQLGISLSMVGILIVGLGNCFPETYFSIVSAIRGENWMILGNLMGSVIICATLVLGVIVIISPFQINDFSPFLITRLFTMVASLMFIFFMRTEKKITKIEGLLFLSVYILFLLVQVFFPHVVSY
jgi:cation:H+ antiporter